MQTLVLAVVATLFFVTTAVSSHGAPLKAFVAEFSVSGSANKEDLKTSLQGILASRLNPAQAQLVENADKAELLVIGSYALFGRMFSLDVLLKNGATGTLSKVFEQGEGQDDLLPAMGRLSQKIERELARRLPTVTIAATTAAPAPAVAAPASPSASAPAASGYVVKESAPPGSWASAPLNGIFTGIALGRTLPSGERELFVAGDHAVRYYLQGTDLKLMAEATVASPAKVLAIDAADLDRDGTPELYVTVMDRESLSSRVYQPDKNALLLIADHQPWFFRGIGDALHDRTIYAQGMTTGGDYDHGVAELVKLGNRFETKHALKLPAGATIHNFLPFRDKTGAERIALLNEDGYLTIHGTDGSELWKSSDKFGGSEAHFKIESLQRLRSSGDQFRWTFLEQRLFLLPKGLLLVPRNEGTFSVGNSRSFNKHSLHALQWNGTMLKEAWHTRQSPSYLADYAYDRSRNEVILLELVQRPGLFASGKSAISVNAVE